MNECVFPRREDLKSLPARELFSAHDPVLEQVSKIVDRVKSEGWSALTSYVNQFDNTPEGAKLIFGVNDLEKAKASLRKKDRALLNRIAARIEHFSRAQFNSLSRLSVPEPGGTAGHRISPVEKAGCYAPGGTYPLPSSILMTVIPARVAGVSEIWMATPAPSTLTLAAACIAGADAVLGAGGAHAIAALAYGAGPVPACDVVVGPGNKFVTTAKKYVAGDVRIDMVAGPSELLVLADETANPVRIAADLIAQAEHDEDALPVLITTSASIQEKVELCLAEQLSDLPTAPVARVSLYNGGSILASDVAEMITLSDELAPEHIQICTFGADDIAARLFHFGALFIGHASAEVFGDYGFGPNHTLPTHKYARKTGGLSVFNFTRIQTWLKIDPEGIPEDLVKDSISIARLERLEGHARAAILRLQDQRASAGQIARDD